MKQSKYILTLLLFFILSATRLSFSSIESLNRDIDNAFRRNKTKNSHNSGRCKRRVKRTRKNRRARVSRNKRRSNVKIIRYKIKRGDTLYSLARRYKTTVKIIIRVNRIRNVRDIKTGRIIKIPVNMRKFNPRTAKRNNIKYRNNSPGIPVFIYPVKGRLLSGFGYRRRSKFTRRYTFHPGIDIKGRIGAPIRASASGVVVYSGVRRGYGRVIKIKHKNAFMTVYAHNRVNYVRKGQRVKRGQLIGRVGMSGRTTGSHVHFEIRYKNKPKNPLRFLKKYVTYR